MTPEAAFPVFVIGPPRSGTTLVAVLLARHPRIAVPPETHYFRWMQKKNLAALRGEELVRRAFENEFLLDLGIRPEALLTRQGATDSTPALFSALMQAYAEREGKPRWAEKTPDHLFSAYAIRSYFPQARFLCVLRDGRDAALSLRRVPWGPGDDLWACAQRWWVSAWRAAELLRRWPPTVIRAVRYEELVENPERICRSMCEFIGEDFSPEMLNPRVPTRVIPERHAAWLARAAEPVTRQRVGVWKTASPPERSILQGLLAGMLKELGYNESGDLCDIPVSLRVRVARERAKQAFRRARRRVRIAWARIRRREDSL